MISFDRVNSIIRHHATEKWSLPANIEREETQDNHQGDAKNRQQSSYEEVFNALTDKLNHKYSSSIACIV